MGHKRTRPREKKKGGGLLMGMRSGIQSVAKKVTDGGAPNPAQVPKMRSKAWKLIENIVTAILAVVALAMIARRCGFVRF